MRNYSNSYIQQKVLQAHLLAKHEQAKRELIRRTKKEFISDDPFRDFLVKTTPNYSWDWLHLKYIRKYLEKVTSGEINKIIFELPPRHGKTEMVTVRYPIFRMLQQPSTRVIVAAYNQSLATKFTRKSKRIASTVMSLATDRNASHDWENTEGGSMLAAGIGSGVTGTGADLIAVDDPVKSREDAESRVRRENTYEWFRNDLYTRLEPGGAIIVTMTRWHPEDLAGRILKSENGHEWTVVRIPAIADINDPLGRQEGEALCPERFDLEALENIKKEIGVYAFEALYQNDPKPKEAKLFKEPTFYDQLPKEYRLVVGVDTAYTEDTKADYSAIWVAALTPDKKYYVLYVERWQREYDYTVGHLIELQKKYNTRFAVEANGAQKIIYDMLKKKIRVDKVIRRIDKYAESQAFAEAWNNGKILLPREAKWLDDYLDEVLTFTGFNGEDDQVDASVNAFNKYNSSSSGKI